MNYQEILDQSRPLMGKVCKSCPVCNGKACGNKVPGPGAKGTGTVAIRNYDAWQNIYVNMDTLTSNAPVDTTLELFGKTFKYPIFAGPVGAIQLHYGDSLDDNSYNDILVRGCKEAGIAAFLVMVLIQPSCKLQLNISKKMMVLVYQQSNLGVKKSMMKN